MFALWYFSLAFDELRKHFKFIDNIFVFFNGNDSVLVTSNQPPAIVSKESLNETDEKVPEISEIVSEEQEKESEPEPPVENLAVAEEPKLDEVIEIDDVKSDEDSNPEKIVAFPANNDDSFMFVENQKSKRSTRDTTADFLKSETNKLAENFPSVDSVVEEAKELPAVIDPVSPTKKIEESFIIIDEREKSVETPKEDQKLAEGSQTIETKLDDVVEPMKSTKIDDSFLLVDDQDSKKKSVNVKDATVGFLSAESGKPQTNGISKDTIKTIENIVGKQEFSNESDSIPSDETIGEEAMLENENKLNESIESENSKFDEGVEMKEDDEIDTKLDEKSEQPKSILEIDEEKIAAFIARADDSFLIVDDKKPKKAINIKEKTTDFLQSEIKPMATSVLPSPSQQIESEPLQFTVMLKQKSSKIPKFKDMLPTTKLPTPKLLPSPASSSSAAYRVETKEMLDDKIKHFAQDVTDKLEEIMKTPKLEQITELESEQYFDAKSDASSPPPLEQPIVEGSFILVNVKKQTSIPKLRFETNRMTNVLRYGTLFSFYIYELVICGALTILIIYCLCFYDVIINI